MALKEENLLIRWLPNEKLVALKRDNIHLLITIIQGICDVDFSDKQVTLNAQTYSWADSSTDYPELTGAWLYFVVPDEALEGMPVSDICTAYTLENSRIDAEDLVNALSYTRETENGPDEECDYRVQEYYRLFQYANAGTLIIGTLYVATVFVCMALAILSIKTLSTLEEECRRFAILYRLGADVKMPNLLYVNRLGHSF